MCSDNQSNGKNEYSKYEFSSKQNCNKNSSADNSIKTKPSPPSIKTIKEE